MCSKENDVILEFDNVKKWFPGVQALKGISFQVKRGGVHCIVGENGAGKSTLLKIIDGLYQMEEGRILFDGQPWAPSGSAQALKSGIAMIHQELNIIPEMTIEENIFLGREKMNRDKVSVNSGAMFSETRDYLEEYGIKRTPETKMKDLTIAEAQMIEIIKALSCNAKIVLMDEPTSSLSEKEVELLFDRIERIKSAGITVIYISHRMNELFRIGDYITVFRDGSHIDTGPIQNFTKDTIIEKMVGRKMAEVYPERTTCVGEVIFKAENFSHGKQFKNITFELRKGEILGVAGLVGAGRSEIARSIIGLDPKDSGTVYLDGKKIVIHSVNDSIAAEIAMVSEDRRQFGLVMQQSIKENVGLVALRHRFKSWVLKFSEESRMVDELMELLDIRAPSINTIVGNLSGGNQQKVVLAKWLAVSPKVLIMDEPTRGIDVKTKFEIYKLMNEMTQKGISIIMIDSDLEELIGMSDRVLVIHEGAVSGEIQRQDVSAEAIMHLAVGGE